MKPDTHLHQWAFDVPNQSQTDMKNLKILLLIFSFNFGFVQANELPDDSVYHVDSNWTNQDNENLSIQSLSGNIQVVAFIYTYCQHSCPVIISKLKAIESKLEQQNNVQFALFSLDPERDTPEQLKSFHQESEFNDQWNLYSGNPDDVLELAAVFGVRYKPMNNDNQDIAHSNMITILNEKGVVMHQVKGFGEDLSEAIAAINNHNSQ